MRAVIIEDEMQIHLRRRFLVDLLHESQELLMAMTGLAAFENRAFEYIQGGEKGGGAQGPANSEAGRNRPFNTTPVLDTSTVALGFDGTNIYIFQPPGSVTDCYAEVRYGV